MRFLAGAGTITPLLPRGLRGRRQWQLLISGRGGCLRLLLLVEDLLPPGPRRRGLAALASALLGRPLKRLRRPSPRRSPRRSPGLPPGQRAFPAPAEAVSGSAILDLIPATVGHPYPRLRVFTLSLNDPRRRLSRRREVEEYVAWALAQPAESLEPRLRRRLQLIPRLYDLHDRGAENPASPHHALWQSYFLAWDPEPPRNLSRVSRSWALAEEYRAAGATPHLPREPRRRRRPPVAALVSAFFSFGGRRGSAIFLPLGGSPSPFLFSPPFPPAGLF